jgi:DNA-binding SARP family transcriptional activator
VVSEALGADLGAPTTAAELASSLDGTPGRPALLVLDDAHELEGSPAELELSELLRLRPRHVRIAVGTRRPLSTNTPRLMVSGELVELDTEALRFRSWEVEELFRVVYGEPLSPEGAAALTRRTGGWAAGLMLFHLSTSGKSSVERERAVADLGGRSKLVRSYLTRTVLNELEPERREFLLTTSTLGILTGALCDELLMRQGSAAVLEDLAVRQFFTTPAENGRSYRYHQVLQTLLEGLLVDELGPRAAADLYARSALLLETSGWPREALRAYAMAEDFASVARMLQQSTAPLAMGGRLEAEDARDDPWLALVRARRLHREGAVVAAVAAFREAEALWDDAEFRGRCHEERGAARVWLADVTLSDPQPTWSAGPSPRAVAQAIRAGTLRLPPADRLPGHPLADGVLQLLAGDASAARTTLGHHAVGSPPEQLFADLARVVAELALGVADDPVGTLEQIILTAEVEEQPWAARAARGLQAAVLLVTSREPWRAESCAALVDECERAGDEWGAALLAGALGIADLVRRDPGAAHWLSRSADGATRLNAPVLTAWAEILTAYDASRSAASDAPTRLERARASARVAGLVGAEALIGERLSSAFGTPSPPGRIVIRCLGSFEIELDGKPVALPALRPLPRTLLLFLALHHGREVHREVIIEQLWPGTALDVAVHRLHVAASSVRHCLSDAGLGADAVRRHGSAYTLSLPDVTVDLAVVDDALRMAARCEADGDPWGTLAAQVRAVEAYQGELLGEVGPAEWVVAERDRLRHAVATAAYSAGRLSLLLRSPADALPFARRATVLDPLRDSAWALLAETQEKMGDPSSAAATRREYQLVHEQLTGP